MAVTKNISLDYQDVIVIGRRGENEAVDIVWDISPLVAEFGGGTALVLAKRATDESAYPVTLTEQTENTLTWTVSSVDSCVIGVGKVQLFWYVGNVLAKSFMWRTFTGDDITGMVGDPPEAYESWLEHLAEMGADILNDAKAEVENAEAWAVGERGGEPVVDGDETYHNNAKYWSGVSSDYAGNAESSADAAEQSAGDAAHQVELAEAQVTLAEAQVALAQQKVEDAAAQVTLAEAQANAAAGSASDASGYALAASGYASDANTYKGQAYTSAQNAAQKASDAAGYALAASGSASDANTYKGQAQGFANSASGYADAASDYADAAAASATEAAGYVASLVNGKAGVLEDSASGDVVSIVPDKSVGKLYKAEVSLSPIQSGSGVPSPTNVRPITGHAGATLYRTGKNLFDVEARVDGETSASGSAVSNRYTLNDGVVSISASYSSYGRTMMSAQYLMAGTYTLSFEFSLSGTGSCAFSVRDMSANPKVDIVSDTRFDTSPASKTFTLTEDGEIAISILPSNSTAGTLTATNIQLELGTATPYEPYVGSSYPVSFTDQGAVYAGTYDWVSGKLTVTHKSMLGSDATWNMNSGVAYCTPSPTKKAGVDNFYCSAYEVSDEYWKTLTSGKTCGYTNNNIFVKNDAWAMATDATADLASVQFVYELDSPIVVDLAPTQIQTLLGLNNVWSDGEMSVDYAADLKTYIDNKIAAAVAALS